MEKSISGPNGAEGGEQFWLVDFSTKWGWIEWTDQDFYETVVQNIHFFRVNFSRCCDFWEVIPTYTFHSFQL